MTAPDSIRDPLASPAARRLPLLRFWRQMDAPLREETAANLGLWRQVCFVRLENALAVARYAEKADQLKRALTRHNFDGFYLDECLQAFPKLPLESLPADDVHLNARRLSEALRVILGSDYQEIIAEGKSFNEAAILPAAAWRSLLEQKVEKLLPAFERLADPGVLFPTLINAAQKRGVLDSPSLRERLQSPISWLGEQKQYFLRSLSASRMRAPVVSRAWVWLMVPMVLGGFLMFLGHHFHWSHHSPGNTVEPMPAVVTPSAVPLQNQSSLKPAEATNQTTGDSKNTEAEAQRRAEGMRLAEEKVAAEKAKAEAEAKRVEEARAKAEAEAKRIAEEKRQADAQAQAEAQRRAEEARLATEKAAAEKAKAEAEAKQAEEARVKAEAEAKRVAEEKRQAEAQAQVEAQHRAEEARLAAEKAAAEKAKAEAEAKQIEEAHVKAEAEAEAKRIAKAARSAEEKRKAEQPAVESKTPAATPAPQPAASNPVPREPSVADLDNQLAALDLRYQNNEVTPKEYAARRAEIVKQKNEIQQRTEGAGTAALATADQPVLQPPPLPVKTPDLPPQSQINVQWNANGGLGTLAISNGKKSVKIEFLRLEGGTYQRGNGAEDAPKEKATLSPFYLSKDKITAAAWQLVFPNSVPEKSADRAKDGISWSDAQDFCKTIAEGGGALGAFSTVRLPLEVEWEYVAQREFIAEGAQRQFSNFNDDLAEWMQDVYSEKAYWSYKDNQSYPVNAPSDLTVEHVVRGGLDSSGQAIIYRRLRADDRRTSKGKGIRLVVIPK